MKTLLLEQSNVYKKSSDSCIEIVQDVHVYDTDYSRLQLSCIAREIKYCPKKCKESLNGQKQIILRYNIQWEKQLSV